MNLVTSIGPVYHISGRSLGRQLRNGTDADRARILRDLLSGKLIVTDLTKKQIEHLVAACLVGAPRPLDEKRLRARLARKAERAVDTCGLDVMWAAIDRKTQPELPLQQAAE